MVKSRRRGWATLWRATLRCLLILMPPDLADNFFGLRFHAVAGEQRDGDRGAGKQNGENTFHDGFPRESCYARGRWLEPVCNTHP